MDNYSTAILWGDKSTRQDLPSFLSICYRAIERYGSLEALVTDSGSVFLANRAKPIHAALGIEKHEIEQGEPWQNYGEAQFSVQNRIADHHFSEAASWQELVAVHDRWMGGYNVQRHFAHEDRKDGRRRPVEVLNAAVHRARRTQHEREPRASCKTGLRERSTTCSSTRTVKGIYHEGNRSGRLRLT